MSLILDGHKHVSELGLLGRELNKLAKRGLKVAVRLSLAFAVLSTSIGIVVVLAAPGGYTTLASPETRLVHLQFLGGLLHLHDGTHGDHYASNQSTTSGVTQVVYAPDTTSQAEASQFSYSVYGNSTVESSDYGSSLWRVVAPKYHGLSANLILPLATLLSRPLSFDQRQPANPYLVVPHRPPVIS